MLVPMPEEPVLYLNLMPERLPAELRDGERLGVTMATAPGADFDALVAKGELLNYVVLQSRRLVVCEAIGYPAHHSVLAGGAPVMAAGEVSLLVYEGVRTVLDLNAVSGHYRPAPGCLAVVRELLESLGFDVPDSSLSS